MGTALTLRFEKRYSPQIRVRAELDVSFDSPGMTVLFGPSGAGKSTILRCVAGLDAPTTGTIAVGDEIWFDAERRVNRSPQERRVGFVFQEDALFPHLSVRDNVEFGLRRHAHVDRRRRGDEMMELVGIARLAQRRPAELSGGERRRVAVARALAPSPRLLLLDEPLAALDASARASIRRDLRAVLVERGIPTLIVTHDRIEALALGDTMAVVVDGRVAQHGSVADVCSRPSEEAVARVVGIETVVSGRIRDVDAGLLTVEVGGATLRVLERPTGIRGEVIVAIRAEDVVLERSPQAATSARNALVGPVTAVEPEGPVLRVVVDCGFLLAALVTHQAIEDLGLAVGDTVTAKVKATAVHLIERRARPLSI